MSKRMEEEEIEQEIIDAVIAESRNDSRNGSKKDNAMQYALEQPEYNAVTGPDGDMVYGEYLTLNDLNLYKDESSYPEIKKLDNDKLELCFKDVQKKDESIKLDPDCLSNLFKEKLYYIGDIPRIGQVSDLSYFIPDSNLKHEFNERKITPIIEEKPIVGEKPVNKCNDRWNEILTMALGYSPVDHPGSYYYHGKEEKLPRMSEEVLPLYKSDDKQFDADTQLAMALSLDHKNDVQSVFEEKPSLKRQNIQIRKYVREILRKINEIRRNCVNEIKKLGISENEFLNCINKEQAQPGTGSTELQEKVMKLYNDINDEPECDHASLIALVAVEVYGKCEYEKMQIENSSYTYEHHNIMKVAENVITRNVKEIMTYMIIPNKALVEKWMGFHNDKKLNKTKMSANIMNPNKVNKVMELLTENVKYMDIFAKHRIEIIDVFKAEEEEFNKASKLLEQLDAKFQWALKN